MKIKITRPNAPVTKLNIEIICQHKNKIGEQLPVAFILPGGPGADHTGYLNYTCLSEVADLVFHDPRGCGDSDKGDKASYTMENYIDDVEAIREHLSLEKIIVIGKSYGSMCALGYALRYPDVVDKLVLAAGSPSYRFIDTAKKNLMRAGTPEQIRVAEKLWSGSFESLDDVLNYFHVMNTLYSVKARTQPESFDLIGKNSKFSYEVLNEGFRHSFWRFDYENDLQRILCPTLILAGRQDWVNDVRHAEFMVARIPHSQLQVFERSSHAMEADVTEEYFQTIADFIHA